MNFHSKIRGEIHVPSSKSLTQRAVAAAMLANGTSIIRNPSLCADAQAALHIALLMGAEVLKQDDEWYISGNFRAPAHPLDCGESALCARLFTPIAALHDSPVELTGRGTLLNRSMNDVLAVLNTFGVTSNSQFSILNSQFKGPLKSTHATIDGGATSQTLSGLLMALPMADGDSEIRVQNLVSRAYVDMTIELLRTFGIIIENQNYQLFHIKGGQCYAPQTYTVEGDWSSAAYWLATAAINGNFVLHGLHRDSLQPDKAMLQVVQMIGAEAGWIDDALHVCSGERQPFRFDATDCPDLFPPLVLLAAFCNGRSEITGTKRLVNKESNRALALQETFKKLGVSIELTDNTLIVQGGKALHGAAVSSFHDHRIAMAAACAGLFTEGKIQIDDTDCINKSYPDFLMDLESLTLN